MRCQARECKRTTNTTGMQTACAACNRHACNLTVAPPRSCYILNAMLTMAGCRPLRTASSEVVSPLSRNAAFEDRRCLETPLCARCASRRSVAACRCLLYIFIIEAQASRLEAGDSMWLEPSPGTTLPLPRCQPCPSSPIGHNDFLRLHRVEAICPRDARCRIRCNAVAPERSHRTVPASRTNRRLPRLIIAAVPAEGLLHGKSMRSCCRWRISEGLERALEEVAQATTQKTGFNYGEWKARLVTAAQVFRENPQKRFKSAESCLPGTQSFVGHSGPCELGAFAGKGPSTSELMLRVHNLCENRPARRLQVPSPRSDRRAHRHVPVGTDCRLLVPISVGHCKLD